MSLHAHALASACAAQSNAGTGGDRARATPRWQEEYRHARVLSTATAAEAAEQAPPAQPQAARTCSHARQGTSTRDGGGSRD